jgi:AraC-like DNA-binding protein
MRMVAMMLPDSAAGLERSCGRDWVRIGPSRPGFERAEVCFATQSFAPHRHDTYTIGITLQGVQEFTYRGGAVRSLAGQAFVLHPDELHDGRPGSEGGFRYRALYVEPHLIQEALEGRSLPFLRSAVTDDARLRAAILAALEDLDIAVGDLHFDQSFVQLAEMLAMLDPSSRHHRRESPNARNANAAREFLEANFLASISSTTLARVSGLSRFALTRHFRACFGTSPHRYVIMRRLDRARDLIRTGTPLAEAASASGFADQAHMTRHFRKAYGVSPARWRAMLS